jgi:hypothetical protein
MHGPGLIIGIVGLVVAFVTLIIQVATYRKEK